MLTRLNSPFTKGLAGGLLGTAACLLIVWLGWRFYQTDQLARAAVGWINQQVQQAQQRQGLAPKPVQPAP